MENAKAKARLLLSESDRRYICLALASAVVDAGHLVKMTERRDVLNPPQRKDRMEIRGK